MSSAAGHQSHSFLASLAPDGAARWLRASPDVLTIIGRADGHDLLAVQHSRTHDERVVYIDAQTGARTHASRVTPSTALARALRRDDAVRARLAGARRTDRGDTYALAAPRSGPLTPEHVRRLARLDPEGAAPELAELPDGSHALILPFSGTLRLGTHTASSAHRMVRCHPGNDGEEHPMPRDCREPLDRPSAALVVWR